MANWGGMAGGAASGAQLGGSIVPGWGHAIGGIAGALGGLFSGGKNPQEQLALEQMRAQMERSNQFWQQAQGQMGAAQRYFAPIAGGSRTAAFQSMAPEITSATQRMDAGRTSLLNLSGRSGGASARLDPYAKGSMATSLLMKARPGAANAMMQMAGITGGWAQNQGGATQGLAEQGRWEQEQAAKRGAGFYDSLTSLGKDLRGWMDKRGTQGGGTPPAGSGTSGFSMGNLNINPSSWGGNSSFIDPRTYGSKPVPGVLY